MEGLRKLKLDRVGLQAERRIGPDASVKKVVISHSHFVGHPTQAEKNTWSTVRDAVRHKGGTHETCPMEERDRTFVLPKAPLTALAGDVRGVDYRARSF